jgi:diguanylate cyclase
MGVSVQGAFSKASTVRGAITRARHWIFPPVPDDIADALHLAQFTTVQRQAPMLLWVAALNVIIVMAVCAHDGIALQTYAWMAGLVLYCVVRGVFLHRKMAARVSREQMRKILKLNVALSLGMITMLGIVTSYTFVAGTFVFETLIPISLAFGATSIAHCLYALRPAAIGTLIMGMLPQSIMMILFGDFQAVMLGIATLTVALLMIRFVAAQYDQLVASLRLEKENCDLANTDVLTGLPNRRAIMASLDRQVAEGARFGLALLDLDGFKGVNDTLGHLAGDALLQHVANRLSGSTLPSDVAGRLGGDEFIILFRDIEQDTDVSSRATAMLAALCVPADIDGTRVPVAASLGHALFPNDAGCIENLLITADKALYAAKESGKEKGEARLRSAA